MLTLPWARPRPSWSVANTHDGAGGWHLARPSSAGTARDLVTKQPLPLTPVERRKVAIRARAPTRQAEVEPLTIPASRQESVRRWVCWPCSRQRPGRILLRGMATWLPGLLLSNYTDCVAGLASLRSPDVTTEAGRHKEGKNATRVKSKKI